MKEMVLPDAAIVTEVTAQIGFRTARRALRSGDRCTWLEAVPTMPGDNPLVSRTCGPDLYGGTAGIGWFLAELAVRVPDRLLHATALAALRHASARVADHPGAGVHGCYGGRAGVGMALVLAGLTLDDAQAVDSGRAILSDQSVAADVPDATDLVSGLAGSVLALAVAGDALGEHALIARATEGAAALIALGTHDAQGGLSWPSMPGTRANLTGFAHGTAGIAYALLVVDALAPDAALRAAALAAVRYEDGTYDPARAGWPDYRVLPGYSPEQLFYPVAWCHGAAGIAQMRLAAHGRIGGGAMLDAAIVATAAETARLASVPGIDQTLCHGVFGLADVLLDVVRAGRVEGASALATVLHHAVAAYHEAERPWPSGLATHEEIDGLMLGSTGIGWLFLRVADPALASPLMPGAAILARQSVGR